MKFTRSIAFLVLILLIKSTFGQLTLYSDKKQYNIKANDDCFITSLTFENEIAQDVYYVYFGTVEYENDSTINLNMTGKNTIYTNLDGTTRIDGKSFDFGSTEKINLRLSEIQELGSDRKWLLAPAVVGWLALVSGVVVSPLISIDYRNGGFNKDRFLKTSGISLGITSTTFLLAYQFGRHTAHINPGTKKKRVWKLKAN